MRTRILPAAGPVVAIVALAAAGLGCGGSTAPVVTATTPSATQVSVTTTSSMVVDTTVPQTTVSVIPIPTASSTTPTTSPLPPLIVLDPGHSGTRLTTIDPATEIRDEEYLNTPETKNVFEVAVLLRDKLQAAGYRVLMTKQAWDDTVCKRDRVNVANENDAALGVSIHTSGHTFGHYGQIYVQRMDSYRENIHGGKVYFGLPEVAALSARYGEIFLEERRKIEGRSVVITVNTSWGGRGLAPGNLPIVQLFAEVPWLLVEAGVPQNENDKELYAQSLFNSIARCVPIGGTTQDDVAGGS